MTYLVYLQKAAINDDASLTIALEPYTELLFQNKFSYQWGDDPKDYPDGESYLKVDADALGYFEGGKSDKVADFVKSKLLK
jgi:hypothetical protein